ncbi:UDP-glycosyltransferase 72E2-like protein [Drosera capensis]
MTLITAVIFQFPAAILLFPTSGSRRRRPTEVRPTGRGDVAGLGLWWLMMMRTTASGLEARTNGDNGSWQHSSSSGRHRLCGSGPRGRFVVAGLVTGSRGNWTWRLKQGAAGGSRLWARWPDLRIPLVDVSTNLSSTGVLATPTFGSHLGPYLLSWVRGVHGRCIKAPVLAVGPLVSETGRSDLRSEVMEWLDKQPAESVLLISFGTGRTLMTRQTIEMAWGLELSQQRFFRVIRQPLDYDASASQYFESKAGDEHLVARYLTQGFLDRTKEKGKVVPLWDPGRRFLPTA